MKKLIKILVLCMIALVPMATSAQTVEKSYYDFLNPSDSTKKISNDTGKVSYCTKTSLRVPKNDSLYSQMYFHLQSLLLKYDEGVSSIFVYNNKKQEKYFVERNGDTFSVIPFLENSNSCKSSIITFKLSDSSFIFEEIYKNILGKYYTAGEYSQSKKNLLNFMIKLEDAFVAEGKIQK